jgi:hypothetical protein
MFSNRSVAFRLGDESRMRLRPSFGERDGEPRGPAVGQPRFTVEIYGRVGALAVCRKAAIGMSTSVVAEPPDPKVYCNAERLAESEAGSSQHLLEMKTS